MASLEALGLQNGGKLEVLVYFNLDVSVHGKGRGYQRVVEVGPEEPMDVIETRVSFVRMFTQRGFEIYAPNEDRVFKHEELSTLLFRDSSLKNNSKLILLAPDKQQVNSDGEPVEDDDDSDEEMESEGGEDE